MVQKVFSVYDSKAEAYLPPFYAPTKGIALRSFEQAANKEGHEFAKHASDFTLFEIGEFDDSSGQIKNLPAKISLGSANEFKKSN